MALGGLHEDDRFLGLTSASGLWRPIEEKSVTKRPMQINFCRPAPTPKVRLRPGFRLPAGFCGYSMAAIFSRLSGNSASPAMSVINRRQGAGLARGVENWRRFFPVPWGADTKQFSGVCSLCLVGLCRDWGGQAVAVRGGLAKMPGQVIAVSSREKEPLGRRNGTPPGPVRFIPQAAIDGHRPGPVVKVAFGEIDWQESKYLLWVRPMRPIWTGAR